MFYWSMPFQRKRSALQFTEQERGKLESIRKSRTEEKRRTLRAAILLDSLSGQSDEGIARRHRVSRGTVVLCIQKCLEFGLDAPLGELPRSGKPRQLPDDAIAWVQNCACQKPSELGDSYELWTYKLLTTHVRRNCVAAGHPALQKLSRSKLHKILRKGELRPHKIRYYVERRDPAFEAKMAHVLHVYKQVEIVNEYVLQNGVRQLGMVTISYDDKPGIQALAVTTPDRPPVVGQYPSHLRDYEYERLGTVSLLAGLELAHWKGHRNRQRHTQQRRFHRLPAEAGCHLCRASEDPLGVGQPFRAHFQRDAELPGNRTPALRLCLHAETRLVAQSH